MMLETQIDFGDVVTPSLSLCRASGAQMMLFRHSTTNRTRVVIHTLHLNKLSSLLVEYEIDRH